MGKQTVKKRIFISNAFMVVVTLFILLVINSFVIKVYSESVEHELEDSVGDVMDEDGLEELVEDLQSAGINLSCYFWQTEFSAF